MVASQNGHAYRPTSLDFINRPNPVEPHAAPHKHPLDTTPRSNRPQPAQSNQKLFRLLLEPSKDADPFTEGPPAKRRRIVDGVTSHGAATPGSGYMDLPKLPVREGGSKRLRIPPTLSGLQNPPPDAGLLPSMAVQRPVATKARSTDEVAVSQANPDEVESGERDDAPEKVSSDGAKTRRRRSKRKNRWSDEETMYLLKGVANFGIGNWTKILKCPDYEFQRRTALDLKDRFRVCCPDHYKNDQTSANNDGEARLPAADDEPNVRESSPPVKGVKPHKKTASDLRELGIEEPFAKSGRRKRTKYSDEEDQALLRGFRKHGNAWAVIREDAEEGLSGRKPTDLRDRMRTRFPDEFGKFGLTPKKNTGSGTATNESSGNNNTAERRVAKSDDNGTVSAKDRQKSAPKTSRGPQNSATGKEKPATALLGDNHSYEDDVFFSPPSNTLEDERITLDRRILDWPSNNARTNMHSERPIGIDPLATLNLPRPTVAGTTHGAPPAADKPSNSMAALPSLAELTSGMNFGEGLELPSLLALEPEGPEGAESRTLMSLEEMLS